MSQVQRSNPRSLSSSNPLNSNKIRLLKFINEYAWTIRQDSDLSTQILERRLSGEDHLKIALDTNIASKYSIKGRKGMLRSVIAYVLNGNNNGHFGPTYEPLIADEDRNRIRSEILSQSDEHRRAHFQGTPDEYDQKLRNISNAANEAQQNRVWGRGESLLAHILSKSSDYRSRTGYFAKSTDIAEVINDLWHGGKPVVSNKKLNQKLHEIRKGKYQLPQLEGLVKTIPREEATQQYNQ